MSRGFAAENELQVARRIAVSAYNAFRYAMNNVGPRDQQLPHFGDLPDEAQDGWFRSVFVVKAVTEDVQEMPWSTLAQKAYAVYAKAIGEGARPWADLDPKQKIAWDAAARHTLELFEAEELDPEAMEDAEAKWLAWASRRLAYSTGAEVKTL